MKFVFVGASGNGKSTLINRILGTNILPVNMGDACSVKTTIHNVPRSGYKAHVRLARNIKVESLDDDQILALADACVQYGHLDEDYDADIPLKRVPWQRLYDDVVNKANRISHTEYLDDDDLQLDLGSLTHIAIMGLFIEEIVIEGNFPILNRDDMIVELPLSGYIPLTNTQLRQGLDGATQVFDVMSLSYQIPSDKIQEANIICALLPPGKPLHVCITHCKEALRDMAGLSDDSGKRMRREVHPRDLVDVEGFGSTLVKDHTVTTRVFDSGDETGLDIHMLKELIEFIKGGGRM